MALGLMNSYLADVNVLQFMCGSSITIVNCGLRSKIWSICGWRSPVTEAICSAVCGPWEIPVEPCSPQREDSERFHLRSLARRVRFKRSYSNHRILVPYSIWWEIFIWPRTDDPKEFTDIPPHPFVTQQKTSGSGRDSKHRMYSNCVKKMQHDKIGALRSDRTTNLVADQPQRFSVCAQHGIRPLALSRKRFRIYFITNSHQLWYRKFEPPISSVCHVINS